MLFPRSPFEQIPSLAVDFNAASESYSFGDLATVPSSDVDFTVETWNYFTSLAGFKEYVGKATSTTGWYLMVASGGGTNFQIAFDDARVASLGNTQVVNVWTYHCFVHNASANTVQGYYASEGGTLTTGTLTSAIAGPTASTAAMRIGSQDAFPTDGGIVRLAVVRVWRAARSESELLAIWNKRFLPNDAPYPDLAFVWDANLDAGIAPLDHITQTVGTLIGSPTIYFQGPALDWIASLPEWLIEAAAGGTAFTRTFTSAIAHTATVARAAGCARVLTSAIASSATIVRVGACVRVLTSAIASSATIVRVGACVRTFSSAIASSATIVRVGACVRTFSSAIASSATIVRVGACVRTFTSAIAHTRTLTRTINGGATAVTRTISSAIASSATVTRAAGCVRVLTSAIASSSSASRIAARTRAISSAIAQYTTISRVAAGARTLTSSIASSAVVSRTAGQLRSIASSSASSAVVSRVGAFGRSITSVITFLATLVRGNGATDARYFLPAYAQGFHLAQAPTAPMTPAATSAIRQPPMTPTRDLAAAQRRYLEIV